MADVNDLHTALSDLANGVQHLQFSRALDQANQQVQQIRASDASEQQQRAQLQNVSNGLVQHMSLYGVPVDQQQQNQQTIAPQYGSANALFRQGVMTGNKAQMDQAKQEQNFDFDLADKTSLAMAKASGANIWKQMMLDEKRSKDFKDDLVKMNNKIDENTAARGNLGKLGQVNAQIKDAMTMLSDPGKWTPQAMGETIRKLDSVLSQGSATVTGSEHLTPKLSAAMLANIQQSITNKPTAMAGADSWRKYYQDVFSRIQDVNSQVINEGQLKYVRGELPALLKRYGENSISDIQSALSNKIGAPVAIDTKTKDVDLQSNIDTQDQYAAAIQKAAASPNDPRVANVMSTINSDDVNLRRTLLRYPDLRKAYGKLRGAGSK